ncbi:hypothetical protein GO011_06990 [Mycobacterium sp. 20091114027_K0903767]|nr:hypothetical protein [Mycobacterium sp. 20091114027_K0903767]
MTLDAIDIASSNGNIALALYTATGEIFHLPIRRRHAAMLADALLDAARDKALQ